MKKLTRWSIADDPRKPIHRENSAESGGYPTIINDDDMVMVWPTIFSQKPTSLRWKWETRGKHEGRESCFVPPENAPRNLISQRLCISRETSLRFLHAAEAPLFFAFISAAMQTVPRGGKPKLLALYITLKKKKKKCLRNRSMYFVGWKVCWGARKKKKKRRQIVTISRDVINQIIFLQLIYSSNRSWTTALEPFQLACTISDLSVRRSTFNQLDRRIRISTFSLYKNKYGKSRAYIYC